MNFEDEVVTTATASTHTINNRSSSTHSLEYTTSLNRDRIALQELNDRFASYIDTVRKWGDPELFSLNSSGSVEPLNGAIVAEHLASVKKTYDKELDSYRMIYDEVVKDRVRVLELCAEKTNEINSLNAELSKMRSYNAELTDTIESLEAALEKRDLDYLKYSRDLENLKKKEEAKMMEMLELKANLEEQKKALNDERDLRIQFMNRASSLEEKMAFENNLYKEEITTAFNRISELQNVLVTKTPTENVQEYLTYDELAQLRVELQEQLVLAKENVVGDFRQKLGELQAELTETTNQLAEVSISRDKLQQQLSQTQMELASEKAKCNSLETRFQTLEGDHAAQMASMQQNCIAREARLSEVTDQLHNLMYDYEELVGVRVALDTELNAYRKLLESEEKRLKVNLTPRKRTYVETPADGLATITTLLAGRVKFESCDLIAGSFLKFANCSKKQFTLSGCKIRRKATLSNTVEVFKFPPKIIIPLHGLITIYVPSYDGEPDPCIFSMPEPSSWINKGEDTILTLLDSKDQSIAEISITYNKTSSLDSTPVTKRRHGIQHSSLVRTRATATTGSSPSPALARLRAALSSPNTHHYSKPTQDKQHQCTIC